LFFDVIAKQQMAYFFWTTAYIRCNTGPNSQLQKPAAFAFHLSANHLSPPTRLCDRLGFIVHLLNLLVCSCAWDMCNTYWLDEFFLESRKWNICIVLQSFDTDDGWQEGHPV